jgi:hypothetical protein
METVVLPTPPFWLETAILITRRRELWHYASFGLPHRKSFLQDAATKRKMVAFFFPPIFYESSIFFPSGIGCGDLVRLVARCGGVSENGSE